MSDISFLQFLMFSSRRQRYLQLIQHGPPSSSFAISGGGRQVGHVPPPHLFHCHLVGCDLCPDSLMEKWR